VLGDEFVEGVAELVDAFLASGPRMPMVIVEWVE